MQDLYPQNISLTLVMVMSHFPASHFLAVELRSNTAKKKSTDNVGSEGLFILHLELADLGQAYRDKPRMRFRRLELGFRGRVMASVRDGGE